jgi:16S rRNA (cytosine967-C5)-methyltransferase
VNAVLRGYLRERSSTEAQLVELKRAQPALGYSHPEWLCQRWRERWGEEPLRRLLEWNNTPPPIYARLNTLRATPDQLTREWTREGVDHAPAPCRWTRPGLVYEVKRHPPLTTLPSFRQGFFYIQDPSTLLAVTVLQPQPGETVLDLCAAPGGKTTFLAQCMGNRGVIVASDPDPARCVQLRANCDRLGVTCVRWAETDADPNAPAPASFDRVLVDAPCSNTGVMRRRVELRWRIRPEELERLRRGQSGLLREAAARVEAGGTLVYSTCSLEPEENEQAVAEFLATQPGFRLEAEHRLAPFQDQVDGAYVAKLRREPRTSPCEE